MATNGLVVMTPTSIAYSGTSATPNADGSVSFSAVTSLSLNGVFTSDYDNYMIDVRGTATGNSYLEARLRVGGVDEASASNYYTRQVLYAESQTVAGSRSSQNEFRVGNFTSTQAWGVTLNCFGPYLAQPTAFRSVTVSDYSSAYIEDYACTHSLSTSYDGITFIVTNSQTQSGLVTVFGFNQ